MKIFKQKGGVISEKDCWVCIATYKGMPYLYIADTFLGLIKILLTEFAKDRHLVG
jgi:hypothetical protein